MGKKKLSRGEKQELTPKQQAAEIEDLLANGKSVEDIVSKFSNLADGWDEVTDAVKAKAIETLTNEGHDADEVIGTYPELASGLEAYGELIAAKQKTSSRKSRGGGAVGAAIAEPF